VGVPVELLIRCSAMIFKKMGYSVVDGTCSQMIIAFHWLMNYDEYFYCLVLWRTFFFEVI